MRHAPRVQVSQPRRHLVRRGEAPRERRRRPVARRGALQHRLQRLVQPRHHQPVLWARGVRGGRGKAKHAHHVVMREAHLQRRLRLQRRHRGGRQLAPRGQLLHRHAHEGVGGSNHEAKGAVAKHEGAAVLVPLIEAQL
jgi:hypothetical protein